MVLQLLLLISIQSSLLLLSSAEYSPCPTGWIYSNPYSSCYLPLSKDTSYTFEEARNSCRAFDNNSDLLYLDEQNEEEELFLTYWQFQNEKSWIGAELIDGILTWVSGEEVNESTILKISEKSNASVCVALIRNEKIVKLIFISCDQNLKSIIVKRRVQNVIPTRIIN